MFALLSPRSPGFALLSLLMWLSLISTASGADQSPENPSCVYPTDRDIAQESDLTAAVGGTVTVPDIGLDDRIDSLVPRHVLISKALLPQETRLVVASLLLLPVFTHGDAWPQAPPEAS